jgi:hypothetical protein
MVAISLVPIFGMMGLAIDVGQLRFANLRLQMPANAAASAGALELNTCGATADGSALVRRRRIWPKGLNGHSTCVTRRW